MSGYDFTSKPVMSEVVKYEAPGRYSREGVTILAGDGEARALVLGQVLGKVTKGAPAAAADPGNTGDGAAGVIVLGGKAQVGAYVLECVEAGGQVAGAASMVADPGNTGAGIMGEVIVGAEAIPGDYILECVEEAAGAGRFSVLDPNGDRLADLTVGVAYATGHLSMTLADGDPDFAAGDKFTITVAAEDADAGRFAVVSPEGYRLPDLTVGVAYAGDHINFTLADGETDFAAGDKLTITVPAGSGKCVAIDFTATDGSQDAAGVLLYDATAPDGSDDYGVALVRHAIMAPSLLVWPEGATTNQKNAATAQLKALGILASEEA